MKIDGREIKEYEIYGIEFRDEKMFVKLTGGQVFSIPVEEFWRLDEATPEQRNNYTIRRKRAIHWPDIDEDIHFTDYSLDNARRRLNLALVKFYNKDTPTYHLAAMAKFRRYKAELWERGLLWADELHDKVK